MGKIRNIIEKIKEIISFECPEDDTNIYDGHSFDSDCEDCYDCQYNYNCPHYRCGFYDREDYEECEQHKEECRCNEFRIF